MSTLANTVSSFQPQVPSAPSTPAQVAASSSVLDSGHLDLDTMTPDALLLYLNSRMGSLDKQMNTVFDRQKNTEKVRGELRAIQELLTGLETKTDEQAPIDLSKATYEEITAHVRNIADIDPKLYEKLSAQLSQDGQILGGEALTYTTAEVKNTQDCLKLVGSDLEAGSQMDMINLQSLMGTRQTAIQLSTNLISALNESEKSVVSNIR